LPTGCSDALGNYIQTSITVTSDTTAPTVEILFPADTHDTRIAVLLSRRENP